MKSINKRVIVSLLLFIISVFIHSFFFFQGISEKKIEEGFIAYKGCFRDKMSRNLQNRYDKDGKITIDQCIERVKSDGKRYMGLQCINCGGDAYHPQCFGGNDYNLATSLGTFSKGQSLPNYSYTNCTTTYNDSSKTYPYNVGGTWTQAIYDLQG